MAPELLVGHCWYSIRNERSVSKTTGMEPTHGQFRRLSHFDYRATTTAHLSSFSIMDSKGLETLRPTILKGTKQAGRSITCRLYVGSSKVSRSGARKSRSDCGPAGRQARIPRRQRMIRSPWHLTSMKSSTAAPRQRSNAAPDDNPRNVEYCAAPPEALPMKMEMLEPLDCSYLRHVRKCWIVQANWKAAGTWSKREFGGSTRCTVSGGEPVQRIVRPPAPTASQPPTACSPSAPSPGGRAWRSSARSRSTTGTRRGPSSRPHPPRLRIPPSRSTG